MRSPRAKDERNTAKFKETRLTPRLGAAASSWAIISSMTVEERRNPAIIHGSRRLRIARGSGTTTADVNSLLKEFEQARKMMKSMMGGGRRMPKLPGGFPGMPGMGG